MPLPRLGRQKPSIPHPQMTELEVRVVVDFAAQFPTLLELGSGASTVQFSKKFADVVSLESRYSWFHTVKMWLDREGIDNVSLVFAAPESVAFDRDGGEVWNERYPSDYGKLGEFQKYYEIGCELIDANPGALIFVDGHLREELARYALDRNLDQKVLVHDVIPERDYLNSWMFEPPFEANSLVDSLYAVGLSQRLVL